MNGNVLEPREFLNDDDDDNENNNGDGVSRKSDANYFWLR